MASGPIISGADLAEHLGGQANAGLCDLLAEAISATLAGIIDAPAEADPWPAEARSAGLMAGADMYKAATGTGGGYQLDAATYTDAFRVTPTFLRRYEPLFVHLRAVGGMLG